MTAILPVSIMRLLLASGRYWALAGAGGGRRRAAGRIVVPQFGPGREVDRNRSSPSPLRDVLLPLRHPPERPRCSRCRPSSS